METVTVETFTFDELSDKAKEVARTWYREVNYDDSSILQESFEQDLENFFFFPMENVYFSLGYCQGDGVAFTGTIDFDALMKWKGGEPGLLKSRKHIRQLIRKLHRADVYIYGKVTHFGHYYHWNSMNVTIDAESQIGVLTPKQEEWVDEIKGAIAELCKELSKKLEKIGYNEIEYQNSDEVVDENIMANEYKFTKEGKRTFVL
jgi:hypothetical protein